MCGRYQYTNYVAYLTQCFPKKIHFKKINHEIESYGDTLISKQKIIVANKMDLPEAEGHLLKFKKEIKNSILTVSALDKKGLSELKATIQSILCPDDSQKQLNE